MYQKRWDNHYIKFLVHIFCVRRALLLLKSLQHHPFLLHLLSKAAAQHLMHHIHAQRIESCVYVFAARGDELRRRRRSGNDDNHLGELFAAQCRAFGESKSCDETKLKSWWMHSTAAASLDPPLARAPTDLFLFWVKAATHSERIPGV